MGSEDRARPASGSREVLAEANAPAWRLALEAAGDGVWDWHVPSGQVACSDGCFAMLGQTPHPQPVPLAQWSAWLHPDDRPRVDAALEALRVPGEGRLAVCCRLRRQDGIWQPVLLRGAVVERDDDGRALRVVATQLDAAAHPAAVAPGEDEAAYSRLLERAPDALLINRDDRIAYANAAAVRLFGGDGPDALVGRPIFELLHPDEHERIRGRIARLRAQHQSDGPMEQRIVRLDGRIVDVEVSAAPHHDASGVAIEVILREVTARKQAEARHVALGEALREVIEAADELLESGSLDELLRRSVELPRERLGLERCGLFLGDGELLTLRGTYGTDLLGQTQDVRDWRLPLYTAWQDLILASPGGGPRWQLRHDAPLYHASELVGHGEHAVTLVQAGDRVIGVLLNDNALSGQPLDPVRQEAVAVYCSMLGNIIERKHVEETSQKHLAQLESTLDSLTEGVVVADLDGYILQWNRAALAMHGFASLADAQLRLPAFREQYDLYEPDGRLVPKDGGPLSRVLAGEPVRDCELIIRHRQGGWQRTVVYNGRLAVDAAGEPLMAVLSITDVGARRQAAEALHRYEMLAHNSRDIILMVELDGRLLEANDAAVAAYGYPRDELLGLTIHRLRTQDTAELTNAQIREADAHGILFETLHQRRDGSTFPVEVSSHGADFEGRRVLLSIVRDISERQASAQALADEAERRRVLVDQSRDGIVVLDEHGRVEEANLRYAQMLGYTPQEMPSLHVWDWDAQWPAGELVDRLREIGSEGHYFETRQRRKDGSLLHVEVSANGAVVGGRKRIFCVCRDITARKAAEAELQASQERYQSLFHGMLEAAAVHELSYGEDGQPCDYRFLFVNPAFERLTDLRAEQVLGRTALEVFPELEPVWLNRYARVCATGEPIQFESYAKALGRYYAVSAFANGPHQFTTVFTDATAAHTEAVRRQLVAALSEFFVRRPASDEALDDVCRMIAETVGVSMVAIERHDAARGVMRFEGTCGLAERGITRGYEAELDACSGGWVVANGRAVSTLRTPDPPPWGHAPVSALDASTLIAVPLSDGRRVWGALAIADDEVRPELHHLQSALTSAAEHLAHQLLRREAEADRARSHERFEALFQHMIDGAALHELVYDDEGRAVDYRYVAANQAFESMTGLRVADVVGRTVLEVLPGLDQHWIERYARVAETGESIRFDEYVPELDRHYEVAAFRSAPGQFVTISADVTQRRRAEAALQESRADLERAQAVARIGGWRVDARTGVHKWSEQAKRLFGLGAADAEALPSVFAAVHPDDRGALTEAFISARQAGTWEFEFRVVTDGTVRWLRAIAEAERDEDGSLLGWFGTVQDISERKTAETERSTLEARLRQAQKLEAVGRLAGGVAHDFNNMLGVILGYSEMALASIGPAHPLYDDLQEIVSAARRSGDLTRQLLAFSRQQLIAPVVLGLNAQLEGMERLLQRIIGEDIALRFDLDQSLPAVYLDPSQVDQVVANLVVNARDAMPEGGQLTVTTAHCRYGAADETEVVGMEPGEYVLLMVSDTGHGMDEQTLAHVFEPFYTTKPEGQGTGLGLATVYGIVKQNHGHIVIDSRPDAGTAVRIWLPRHVPSEEPVAPEPPAPVSHGTGTVLLVEDQEQVRRLTARMLERLGYRVLRASSGEEALQLAASAGEVDLLLTDLVMTGMSGTTLAAELGAQRPGLPTLFMSGYPADTMAVRGVLDAGIHYLQKPFTLHSLGEKLREALGQAAPPAADP